MTNEELVKIFKKAFYITFNNKDSNIRKLVEDSIDEKTSTINLSKMIDNRESVKDANSLLYNFLNNNEVIQNAERFKEFFDKSEDYIYGYPQIYLEKLLDNEFIKEFNDKVGFTYLKRNQKTQNPSDHKHKKFNLVKDFLDSNNRWGKFDFSDVSSREKLDSTTFDSPYRYYAKVAYSKIFIGHEIFTKQGNNAVEDKVNRDWHVEVNKEEQVNPYYILDYGTWALVYILFEEKYWNTYIKAEELMARDEDIVLPTNLRCALANVELAVETINYVLQKSADSSFEPHSFSDIEKYLKSEWSNEPHVKNKNDLIHYEELGTVYPIDKNKVQELRRAFSQLSYDLRKKYSIENDKIYSVSEMIELLKTIFISEKIPDFYYYERIKNIISEFEGKSKTSGGRNSLDEEIDEEGNTKECLISDEQIGDKYYRKNLKIDTDKILSQLNNSFEVTISKINIFFMLDFEYRTFLVQDIKRFSKDFFVNKASSVLHLIENNSDINNRKSTRNKMFFCWKRILKNIISQIYAVEPGLLINCFDQSSSQRINNCENFNDIYSQVKEIDLNVIESSLLRGEKLNKTIYTAIVNNWFESIKKDIQKGFKENKDIFKFAFSTVPGEIKTSTKYVDSITAINLFELNKIIPIENPFIALIKTNDKMLDFETIGIEIEKTVDGGLLEEQTFYKVKFEKLKTGNKEKPAGDIWSSAWSNYKKFGGQLYNESEFQKIMDCIIDVGQSVTRTPIKGQNIYSRLERIYYVEGKSKFMQDLRMLLSEAEIIYDSDKDLEDFYYNVLKIMKKIGYVFLIKYDNKFKESDYEYKSYDYDTSLEEIINE